LSFCDFLKENGWSEVKKDIHYIKEDWILVFDTSSWIEVGTTRNERIFDIPVPEKSKETWALNLINHLCETDDKLNR